MCFVLGVSPAVNNGSLNNVVEMLDHYRRYTLAYILISFTPIISAITTAVVLYIVNKRTQLPGQNLPNNGYIMVAMSESNLLIKNDELAESHDNSLEL